LPLEEGPDPAPGAGEVRSVGGANHRTQDWAREVLRQCGGGGPDVVIDSAGGGAFAKAVLGTTMGSGREFGARLKLYDQHGLRPVVDRVFPLADAAAAHRHMEEAGHFGKIVLRIS